MRLSGTRAAASPRQDVWDRLSDLRALGEALPQVQEVDVEGSERLRARFRPLTGLGATPVEMSFEVTEREDGKRLGLRGDGGSAEYAVHLRASLDLLDAEGGTEISWELDLHLHGVLRSLTQRVIGEIVDQQVGAVLDAATG